MTWSYRRTGQRRAGKTTLKTSWTKEETNLRTNKTNQDGSQRSESHADVNQTRWSESPWQPAEAGHTWHRLKDKLEKEYSQYCDRLAKCSQHPWPPSAGISCSLLAWLINKWIVVVQGQSVSWGEGQSEGGATGPKGTPGLVVTRNGW